MRRGLALAVVAGVLGACTDAGPPEARYPAISFADQPPIALDVASVVIENRYMPPLAPPNVEHRFPISPAAAAERWAQDRLRAVGSHGTATFIIEDASVVEEELETSSGVTGLFTKDQSERYTGTLAVRLEVEQGGGLSSGFTRATSQRSRTVAEGISLAEREDAFYAMAKQLVLDIDDSMARNISQHLGQFVR